MRKRTLKKFKQLAQSHNMLERGVRALGFPGGSSGKKNLPANARDTEDVGLIPGLGRFPVAKNGSHSSILVWKIPWIKEAAGLYSPRGRKDSAIAQDIAEQRGAQNTHKCIWMWDPETPGVPPDVPLELWLVFTPRLVGSEGSRSHGCKPPRHSSQGQCAPWLAWDLTSD